MSSPSTRRSKPNWDSFWCLDSAKSLTRDSVSVEDCFQTQQEVTTSLLPFSHLHCFLFSYVSFGNLDKELANP